jgi:hypothetical protein
MSIRQPGAVFFLSFFLLFETPATAGVALPLTAADDWEHKTNTSTHVLPGTTADPSRPVLRFTITPGQFSYGWINRPLPATGLGQAAGLHGFFRTADTIGGSLCCHLVLPTTAAGEDASFFRFDLGLLEESEGNWVEFYAPFANFVPARGPQKQFRAAALTPNDRIQFLASIRGEKPASIDLCGLAFLSREEAAPLARRLARLRIRRLLSPLEQSRPRALIRACCSPPNACKSCGVKPLPAAKCKAPTSACSNSPNIFCAPSIPISRWRGSWRFRKPPK